MNQICRCSRGLAFGAAIEEQTALDRLRYDGDAPRAPSRRLQRRPGVNSGPKFAEIERFEIAARAHLAVDPLVANGSGTPCPVKAASRRRRGPTASLDGARRSAELGQRDRRRNATRSDNFKPMVLGEIHAAGDRPGSR
jgi:hypothetical protein